MRWLNDYRMRLVQIGYVIGIVLCVGQNADADFTFGEPMNLGSTVNSPDKDSQGCISADGLTLFFVSDRPGNVGAVDIWVTTRPTQDDPWAEPVNLGPTVNSPGDDYAPYISADGLELYFHSEQPDGYGFTDIWVTTRETPNEPWTSPVKLGPPVNGGHFDNGPCITADCLELFFSSTRPGGLGDHDIWVARRATTEDPWGEPVNLGPKINSSSRDRLASVSSDELTLFFGSQRPGGHGSSDIWMTRRPTVSDDWEPPVNLGPPVNTEYGEDGPSISADGSTLYLNSTRPGGLGRSDLWQVPIIPIVDLNVDGIVDSGDMCIIVDHWGEDYPLCDIGPMPWGDGIVDVQDLIVLAEHLFEEIPSAEPVE
ncbi:hypothetical protein ACFL5F_05280 [Planctomycetota bacterium]